MLAAERRRKILELLTADERAEVPDLAVRFNVSESTVRRDLQVLSQDGAVERTRGGALPSRAQEPSFVEKETTNRQQKAAIAQAAVELIRPGETVFLDAGTTTYELAMALRRRTDVTVATNSVPVAVELGRTHRLILTGGQVKERTLALVGPIAERTLEQMHVDVAFLGMNGVSATAGLTTPDWAEAATKTRMIAAARTAVVVADSAKLGAITFAKVAGLDEVDLLITDDAAPAQEVSALEAAGLTIRVVSAAPAHAGVTGAGRGAIAGNGSNGSRKAAD